MPKFIVDLWLDGYDTEEEMKEACAEFIYEQLNFTASSVQIKDFKDSDCYKLAEAVAGKFDMWGKNSDISVIAYDILNSVED